MEIDPINFAKEVTQSINSQEIDGAASLEQSKQIDLSQEHTNGRMFEQAVQNAKVASDTSAPPDNTRQSDAKIDREAKLRSDKPLVLNDKDTKHAEELQSHETTNKNLNGEEALIEAFKLRKIDVKKFSSLSIDLIALNGLAIDEQVKSKSNFEEPNTAENQKIKLSTVKPTISFTNKRSEIEKLGEATYDDVIKIEDELGNNIDDTLVRQLNQAAYGKEVASMILDK